MSSIPFILVGYNQDFSWVTEYTDNYLLYDRSDTDEFIKDFPQDRVIKTENVGNADYDRLCYLVDNYDTLPDVFVLAKTNLFKYITKEEFEPLKDNKTFTPLLTQNHKTYQDNNSWVCYYSGGMYHERNDNWYLNQFQTKYFHTFNQFANAFQLQSPSYIPFAPGGNYILTRDAVHKYSKDYYRKMAAMLPYCTLPGEAQMIERAYYLMWK